MDAILQNPFTAKTNSYVYKTFQGSTTIGNGNSSSCNETKYEINYTVPNFKPSMAIFMPKNFYVSTTMYSYLESEPNKLFGCAHNSDSLYTTFQGKSKVLSSPTDLYLRTSIHSNTTDDATADRYTYIKLYTDTNFNTKIYMKSQSLHRDGDWRFYVYTLEFSYNFSIAYLE